MQNSPTQASKVNGRSIDRAMGAWIKIQLSSTLFISLLAMISSRTLPHSKIRAVN